jgi:hypothetical protein
VSALTKEESVAETSERRESAGGAANAAMPLSVCPATQGTTQHAHPVSNHDAPHPGHTHPRRQSALRSSTRGHHTHGYESSHAHQRPPATRPPVPPCAGVRWTHAPPSGAGVAGPVPRRPPTPPAAAVALREAARRGAKGAAGAAQGPRRVRRQQWREQTEPVRTEGTTVAVAQATDESASATDRRDNIVRPEDSCFWLCALTRPAPFQGSALQRKTLRCVSARGVWERWREEEAVARVSSSLCAMQSGSPAPVALALLPRDARALRPTSPLRTRSGGSTWATPEHSTSALEECARKGLTRRAEFVLSGVLLPVLLPCAASSHAAARLFRRH